jgi:hypothetical protein
MKNKNVILKIKWEIEEENIIKSQIRSQQCSEEESDCERKNEWKKRKRKRASIY